MMCGESDQVRDAVARVCAEESQIRACLEHSGDTSSLDRLVAAVRGGDEVSELLDELHAALQRCGDAVGVFGPTRRGGGFPGVRPDGLGPPRRAEVVFLCPRSTCSRAWRPDLLTLPSTPPTCQVHGEPLCWARL